MEIIVIGPSGESVHSPDERLKVNTVPKVRKFILASLNKIKTEKSKKKVK